ncbi:hypothetical protein CWE22_05345 [Pseudidiomarina aestuarii]|uniref:Uncharacterized protein n=2 Tax=Pseudidiomarina aestuarii TaxID=624146 RepID=A0A7Z7ETY1_9GAMM|nr:hypothetical protein CWE22_05345 [Pseudidiomarina aestuarii]
MFSSSVVAADLWSLTKLADTSQTSQRVAEVVINDAVLEAIMVGESVTIPMPSKRADFQLSMVTRHQGGGTSFMGYSPPNHRIQFSNRFGDFDVKLQSGDQNYVVVAENERLFLVLQ